MKRVSEIITIDKIKKWNDGDIITITASTGAGKSYFIKNNLYAFAKAKNKKILMLIHRRNCVNQFQKEIEKDNKTDVIDITTYQSLEKTKLNNNKKIDFNEYEYIICDEFHYFMGDAGFNKTTDISLNMILGQTDKIRIFMSATGDYVKKYINNIKEINTIDYELPINYDFIKSLTFFNKDESLEEFIKEAIEGKEKGIFFIQSTKKAYELHKKFKKDTLFNCSKHNEEYYKYVNADKIDKMLENERFEEQILITTTCLDAGVNIIDDKVKHIVIDVKDIGSLIQCMGRKRLQNQEDKIYLYIKSITNEQLGGMKTQLKRKIEMADYLKEHTVKEFIEKYPRQNDYNNIVYADTVVEKDKSTHKINELMHFKTSIDICEIEFMLQYKKYGYCKYLAKELGIENYRLIEEEYKKKTLEDYLEDNLGQVMLQVKDRKELIEKVDVKSNGKLLKKINNLNGALEERNINYRIVEFPTSKMINRKQKRYPNAWRIEKLVH